jgi:hypothetical protein
VAGIKDHGAESRRIGGGIHVVSDPTDIDLLQKRGREDQEDGDEKIE